MSIYEKLCYYDRRNPDGDPFPDADAPEPRNGCRCHNCFYGLDAMALEIIRLRAVLEKIVENEEVNHRGDSLSAHIARKALSAE